jgi:hypothetical protein
MYRSYEKIRSVREAKDFKRVSKATSSLVAARIIQVENLIGMLIDLQVAAELPLVE